MKKYCSLDIKTHWRNLIPRIDVGNLIVINKSEDEYLIAWGCQSELVFSRYQYNEEKLQDFVDSNQGDYILGYLSYDIKNNETRHIRRENLDSNENDLHFFVPEHVLISKGNRLTYFGEYSKSEISDELTQILEKGYESKIHPGIKLNESLSKSTYLKNLEGIKTNIQNGIIYEMNYCVNFAGTFNEFDSFQTYNELCKNTQAPFSVYFKASDKIVLSASPERFINKKENTIKSQPIKGTAKRGQNQEEDLSIMEKLKADPKEISENVMIVDLVRNDLSKLAQKNSVRVDELCKIYSFKTVHQLISTVSCQLKPKTNFTEVLQALFPMGSMTGAPKISAIKNIHHFENFNRGIYSGAIGFIEPNGNFDFNVVIRTIIADLKKKVISSSVGGAITIQSDPLSEYKECLLKLAAMEKSLC